VTLVVQKFGGSSVADPERIMNVARRVVAAADAGAQVCVVVSAMGDTTDRLLELAAQVSSNPHPREQDMLLTSGERISIALLSMAIIDGGREAISFTGSQAGIVTDTRHGKARIVEMRSERVREALDAGKIAIVAGFQGVSTDLDVTTLVLEPVHFSRYDPLYRGRPSPAYLGTPVRIGDAQLYPLDARAAERSCRSRL